MPRAQRGDLPVGPAVVDDVRPRAGGSAVAICPAVTTTTGPIAGGEGGADGPVDERASADARRRACARAAEAGAGAGGEDDGDDGREPVVRPGRSPRSVTGAVCRARTRRAMTSVTMDVTDA